jgi:hypothetical protein
MLEHEDRETGTPLRKSLWNLLYRVISSTDHSHTAWGAILRGSCLAFFKETIDDLPAADSEASRRAMKDLFFGLPDHRIWDLFEFLLTDDRAGTKEVDRKLLRRGLNRVLDEEGAPVRLLRDRFLPLPGGVDLDAVATAEENLSLFDLPAAARHLQAAVAYLSRRPDPAPAEAVREAVVAVASVVRTLAGGSGEVAMGTVAPVAGRLGIPPGLRQGIDGLLRYGHSASGLPGAGTTGAPLDPAEATFLVVCCSSVVNFLLSRSGGKPRE